MTPLRYLILVSSWLETPTWSIEDIAARTGLSVTHRSGRIIVFANGSNDVLALPNKAGVVVGKIFNRLGGSEQIRDIGDEDGLNASSKCPEDLITQYWGSYVAVLESADSSVCVIRDPSGGLPCYYTCVDDLAAFASDGPILVDAGLLRPSVDWRMVGRILYRHQLPPETTAIVGMSQVHAGCAISVLSGSVEKHVLWSPWNHIHPPPTTRSESNSERLGAAVRSTIGAWSSCFRRPLVGLSGGLDSSIVAICLAEQCPNLACLTLTTSDPMGDERYYAIQICQSIKATLIEARYDYDDLDLDSSVAEGIPIPCGKLHEKSYNRAVREAAARFDTDAFFIGAGGDNVFYSTHSARPLVDRFKREGWSPGVLSTLYDISQITGASFWQIMREAFRLTHPRMKSMNWLLVANYLAPEFVNSEMSQTIEHPWFASEGDVPLGKLGHVKLLLRAMNHIEHRDKTLGMPMISPLLSQPIIETCLSIPSWEACEGGVDRAVARQAFANCLPSVITLREGKGSPEGFIAQFIERNRRMIVERLMDGQLSAHGLLDRSRLERILRPSIKLERDDCPRIMTLLDAEAWANHWMNRSTESVGLPLR